MNGMPPMTIGHYFITEFLMVEVALGHDAQQTIVTLANNSGCCYLEFLSMLVGATQLTDQMAIALGQYTKTSHQLCNTVSEYSLKRYYNDVRSQMTDRQILGYIMTETKGHENPNRIIDLIKKWREHDQSNLD